MRLVGVEVGVKLVGAADGGVTLLGFRIGAGLSVNAATAAALGGGTVDTRRARGPTGNAALTGTAATL